MKTKLLTIITAAFALASPVDCRAATVDFFLHLEGIDGESTDAMHPGTIEVFSFNFGCENPPPASVPNPTGSVKFTGLEVSASVSKASPKLFLACATGVHIRKAVLFVRKAGTTQDYIQITMEDVLVSSWSTSASDGSGIPAASGGDKPTESLSINFTKIEYKYIPYDSHSEAVVGVVDLTPPQ